MLKINFFYLSTYLGRNYFVLWMIRLNRKYFFCVTQSMEMIFEGDESTEAKKAKKD